MKKMNTRISLTIVILSLALAAFSQNKEAVNPNREVNPNALVQTNNPVTYDQRLYDAIYVSISRAHKFLSDTTQVLDCYVLIDHLNRQYGGMPWVLDREQAMRRILETYKNNDDEWYYFLRLTDKETRCPTWQDIQSVTSPIDSVTLQALWSDKLQPVKSDFYKTLIKMSETDDYGLTHALLACLWLEETKYASVETDLEFAETKRRIVTRIKTELLSEVKAWGNVEIEAVALLLYGRQYESIKPDWMNQILAAQKSDGGWAFEQGTEPSIPHTTVLALWALEQYAKPNVINVPWIQLHE